MREGFHQNPAILLLRLQDRAHRAELTTAHLIAPVAPADRRVKNVRSRNLTFSPSRPAARTGLRPSQTTSVKIHAPFRKACPGFESRNDEKSRSSGPVTHGTPSTTVNATMSGIRISHSFPPQRPLRGLLGERSQRAWRVVDQRNVCCSRQSSTASSTNCQIRPACEAQEQRLHHRHVPVAGEPVGERRRNEPGEQRHRERGSRQTASITCIPYCGISTIDAVPSVEAARTLRAFRWT